MQVRSESYAGWRTREVKCIKKRDCMEGFALSQHKWLVGALVSIGT